jgi:hypothetical protein
VMVGATTTKPASEVLQSQRIYGAQGGATSPGFPPLCGAKPPRPPDGLTDQDAKYWRMNTDPLAQAAQWPAPATRGFGAC